MQHFRMCMVAPSAGGKTHLLNQYLHNQLKEKFDDIFIICPTHQYQDVYKKMKLETKYDEPSNGTFDIVMEKVKKNRSENKDSLIIIDDCIKTEILAKNGPVVKEILKLRHEKCSIIILSQYLMAIDPFIRVNCDYLVIFYLPNLLEHKKMIEQLGNNFYDYYLENTQKKYGFVVVNYNVNEFDGHRYSQNFTP